MAGSCERKYHERLMAALARGASVNAAAREAGVSERTAWRWLARHRDEVEAERRKSLLEELAHELGEVHEQFLLAARRVVDLADPQAGARAPEVTAPATRRAPFLSLLGGRHDHMQPTAA